MMAGCRLFLLGSVQVRYGGPVWRWLGTGKVGRLGVRYGDVLCVLGDRQCKDHSTYSKSGTGPGKRLCGTSRSCAVD